MRRHHRILFGFLAAMSMMNTPHAASDQSPLQRPMEDFKAVLAKELGCTWEYSPYNQEIELCQTAALPYSRAEIARESDGNIVVTFGPYLEDADEIARIDKQSGGMREADSAEAQQKSVIDAIAALFPAWKERRAWLRDAIAQSKDRMFQTSLRVDDTSIYVRHFSRSTGSFPDHAYIVLTMEKDLHRFKANPCMDDEQGWARKGCTADDGYVLPNSRPPDNPILLLR